MAKDEHENRWYLGRSNKIDELLDIDGSENNQLTGGTTPSVPNSSQVSSPTITTPQQSLSNHTDTSSSRSVDEMRAAKRQADNDYKQLATEVEKLLRTVEEMGIVQMDQLSSVLSSVVVVVRNTAGPTLLENMQVIRLDLNTSQNYYSYHALNVAILNAMIGNLLKIGDEEYLRLVRLGLVMDFGMLRLPRELRRRDKRLTDEEFVTVRTHPILAAEVLERSGERDHKLIEAVRMHHERFNGRGYPNGLKGSAIDELAHIAAISDTYDAAISRKKFGKQKSPFDILQELFINEGMMLDPSIIRVTVSGFAQMLVGTHVSLSDRSVAKVLEVDMNNLAYPVVRVLNQRIQTGPDLYPVALTGHLPLF